MSSTASGLIPESFIQLVLTKTDIVSFIQEHVKLKKAGANYHACCPFHNEKTPSFTVSQSKQFYHCFGCGAHGDAIRFLMEYQSLNFVEAVERLASRVGLTVPKDPKASAKNQQKVATNTVLNQVAEFYQTQLKHHKQAVSAVNYLKMRGLTGQIAKTFGLGFAPPGWDNLLSHFKTDEHALGVLQETGLIIKHPEHRFYDRFRDRIMFPIRDRRGNVCGFGARVMDNSQPKYLNSPESPSFQKGHCLYGLYESLQPRDKWQMALVVEGYLDVVALAQMGVRGAVATLGTAITSHHLTILFQQVPEIVFCFDGDKAGQAAAWKALQLVLEHLTEERKVQFMHLPSGEDPDSFVRKNGADAFHSLVKNSMPLSSYFFDSLSKMVKPDSVDNRARLASLARPLLEKIPARIFKEMMFEQLAELVASTPQVVRGERAYRPFYPAKGAKKVKAPAPSLVEPAYLASALLLRHPSLFEVVKEKAALLRENEALGVEIFTHLLACMEKEPGLSGDDLRKKLEQQGFDLKPLLDCESKIELVPEQGIEAEFCGAIQLLVVVGREQLAEKLLQKSKQTPLSEVEKKQLKEFLQNLGNQLAS